MKLSIILICVSLISFSSAKLFINPYPSFETHQGIAEDFTGDDGGPLFITPFLENGKDVKEIQKMAAIDHPDLKAFPGYSGFLTVNKSTNGNMFFWYFPSASQPADAPVVLWLQGGPGASSLFGLFTENGPFEGKLSEKSLKPPAYLKFRFSYKVRKGQSSKIFLAFEPPLDLHRQSSWNWFQLR